MTTPNGNQPAPQDGPNGGGDSAPAPQYITNEALDAFRSSLLEAVKGEMGKAVNAAAKAQTDRQLKALGLTPDFLAKLKPAEEPAANEEEGRRRPEGGRPAQEPPTDLAALERRFQDQLAATKGDFEKKLAAAERKTVEERKAREDADRRRVEQQGFTSARDIIAAEVRQGAAVTVLDVLRARGLLIIDPEGTPMFKGVSQEDEPRPFKDGLSDFLKTPEGQLFVPPPQASRGGNGGPKIVPLTPTNGQSPPQQSFDRNFEAQTGQNLTSAFFKS